VSGDRRRVIHPALPGLPHVPAGQPPPTVGVIGGGIAGLTAATALAERGVAVRVWERERHLGGRVGGWNASLADGTRVTMSRGFHAFFRQYYNLRALLRRSDPDLSRLVALPDYPLVDAEGRTDTFRGLPRTPPWNALAFAVRSPTFTPRDLLRLRPRTALPLVNVEVPGTYEQLDDLDAQRFLESLRFPVAARHLAFDVFSRSFFAPPGELSAAELAVMFHLYFLGSSEGLVFDVPRDPFPALWEPLAGRLRGLGAQVHVGSPVSAIEPSGNGGHTVHVDGRPVDVDAVVLAMDIPGLRKLVAASPALGTPGWRGQVDEMPVAPPFLVRRLWLDRPVAAQRHAFLATGGLPPLDNISVLDRYEIEAARWARETGGSVVELHAYSAEGDPEEVAAATLGRLHELYPETRQAGVRGDLVEWRQDCPLFAPGGFARRPAVGTPDPTVVLAGDGVRIDLPVALMERAATTGWQAANLLLSRWGLAGHPLTTVPTQGRFAPLRTLARRL
jgi:isorenieratene synthase